MDGRTHYALCWLDKRHHDCAIREITRLRAKVDGLLKIVREDYVWLDKQDERTMRCGLCDASWDSNYDELADHHKPGCLAAPGEP